MMSLPVRVGLLSAIAWMVGAFVVSIGMALRFDGWGFFHSAVLCTAASAAASISPDR